MARKIFETATNTYTEHAILGHGGAGTVFRVRDADGESFALKCLHTSASAKRRRFKNELCFCLHPGEGHESVPVRIHGDATRECCWTGAMFQRYLGKISSPLPAATYKKL